MIKLSNLLDFIKLAEGLKNETRHSWTSTCRQESVADHSWRLSLLALIIFPRLISNLNQIKVLQLAIIHDLAEALIGDEHYLETNNNSALLEIRQQKDLEGFHPRSIKLIKKDE